MVDVVEGDAPSLREPVGEPDIEDDDVMLMLMLGDCEAEEDTLVESITDMVTDAEALKLSESEAPAVTLPDRDAVEDNDGDVP